MGRDLVICCDGTWNDAPRAEQSERSNVWRFYELAIGAPGETKQYFHGVGTRDLKDWLRGGLWGFGIGKAIREAFGWLAQHYIPGDRIFLIGFSRGAFTARSLAGMIGYRGLNPYLGKLDEQQLEKAVAREYDAYRARIRTTEPVPSIHFVGVFDTVGKLGVPNQRKIANLFDRPKAWAFHDTQLGAHVTHGRHAIAIDESRAEFMPTLWVSSKGEPIYDFAANGRSVKQFWFCGQHSDVGGANRPVANMALSWMLQEAQSCGLAVDKKSARGTRAKFARAALADPARALRIYAARRPAAYALQQRSCCSSQRAGASQAGWGILASSLAASRGGDLHG
ncbi:MAG: DUF2235 domain-containing protein [Kiritimatiellae bacterium]|nr:DUF2235 domain-containing protein [Kiritimatiellia bacterium]